MSAFQTRDFSARRSATEALRKAGIANADYDKFITEVKGRFVIDMAKVAAAIALKAHTGRKINGAAMKDDDEPAKPAPKAAAKPAKAAPAPKAPKRTVSSVARDLIRAGKSNEEVFAALQAEFKLGADKKSYPAWYRSDLKRKGEVIPAPAKA